MKKSQTRHAISITLLTILFCLLSPAWVARGTAEGGVIFYNAVESFNSPMLVRAVSPGGLLNEPFPIALPEPSFAVSSRDGSTLLLTSGDPGRPFKISRNIFSLNLADNAITKVTSFEDSVRTGQGPITTLTNGVASHTNDATWTSYTIHFPYHKALSPDGKRVAVMDLPRTGGSSLSISRTNAPTEQFLGGGRAPVLEVYPSAGPSLIGNLLFQGGHRTGNNHGGDGVDWHPRREEVVGAFRDDIPVTGSSGVRGSEGTVLAVFATDGRLDPFIRKLTRPTGVWDSYVDIFNSIFLRSDENDYAPAISPDGARVAYVRHAIRVDSRIGVFNLPAVCVIRVINYDGAGDQAVLRLAEGLWVTRLAWSPDGTEIAFDLSPQLFTGGVPMLAGDVTRSEIHLVRADGANPRRLVPAPAAYPTWSPRGFPRPPPPQAPALRVARQNNQWELRVSGLTPGREVDLETSTDLIQWTRLSRGNAPASEQTFSLEPALNPSGSQGFFRIVTR